MGELVKTLGRRERNALATRRRVLDAAETLFIRDGYTASTMTAIADMADVAVQTLYAAFGTKRAILTELLAVRVVGDDEATPLQDREEWEAMKSESEPRRQLALLAAIATRIGSRIAALYLVMAAAAGSDPEIADMYQRQQQARYRDQRVVARYLSRKGALRTGLSEAHAADILWTLANPHTYRALVHERQWTTDEYERWLTLVLISALLEEPATGD
jgi:TetR/AcrR family transcriptional regulator of autoinduction and epiphytic fitness